MEYIEIIAKAGRLSSPAILTQIPGHEGFYVVDGNRRCAISSALGLQVQAHLLDFSEAYDRYMGVNAFYGTNNKNMPYQSVYVNRTVVRPGRRDDIYDRLGMLPSELLKQKTVLDVG